MNQTGMDLRTTDLFFNAFGFDPTVLAFSQLLGVNADTPIPNGSSSSVVQLFSITVSPQAPLASTFPVDLSLQDVNGDISPVSTLLIKTSSSTSTPEPGSFGLVALIAFVWMACRLRQRSHRSPSLKTAMVAILLACVTITPASAQGSASLSTVSAGVFDSTSGQLQLSIAINNTGQSGATNVTLQRAMVGSLRVTAPTVFPVALGNIDAGTATSIPISADASTLRAGQRVLVSIQGSYEQNGKTLGFNLNRFITVPPAGTISGSTVTLYNNPTDGHLLTVVDVSGTSFDFFGSRDSSGRAADFTALSVTPKGETPTSYLLSKSHQLSEIDEPNGVVFQFAWSGSRSAQVQMYVNGALLQTFTVNLVSTSTRTNGAVRSLTVVPATSQAAFYNVFAHVSECKGSPATDASVYFQYATAISLINLPSVLIAPGTYAATVPSPNETAAANNEEICSSIGSLVGNVCDWIVEPLANLAEQVEGLYPVFAKPLIIAGGVCDLIGGGGPKGADNLIEGFCKTIPSINTGLNTATSVDAIASVQGGGVLSGGPSATSLPASFDFSFPTVNCQIQNTITLTHNGNTSDVAFRMQVLQGTNVVFSQDLDLGPHASATLTPPTLTPGNYQLNISLRPQGFLVDASYTLTLSLLTFQDGSTSKSGFLNSNTHRLDSYTVIKK